MFFSIGEAGRSSSPRLQGEKRPGSTGSPLRAGWARQGDPSVPAPLAGRQETVPEPARSACARAPTRTPTPGLAPAPEPASGSQNRRRRWPGTTLWVAGKPSQDHTGQRRCPETRGYFNWERPQWAPLGSRALSQHKPSLKENVLMSFPLLCLHYPWEKKKKERTGCDAEAVNIKLSSSLSLQTIFF